MPSGNKRAEMIARREQVASMYLRGMSQQAIADNLGCGQATVSRDLTAIQADWHQSALIDIDEAKSRELARIDQLERTYWIEYELSREDRESTMTKAVQAGDATARKEATKRTEQRLGDPRYLSGIQWCIERRCAILGIDAPKKQEHSGPGKDGAIILQWGNDASRDD